MILELELYKAELELINNFTGTSKEYLLNLIIKLL